MNRELRTDGNLKDISASICEECTSSRARQVVCSAWESEEIHDGTSQKFLTVTPGIRLIGDTRRSDQNRGYNPEKSKGNGFKLSCNWQGV